MGVVMFGQTITTSRHFCLDDVPQHRIFPTQITQYCLKCNLHSTTIDSDLFAAATLSCVVMNEHAGIDSII